MQAVAAEQDPVEHQQITLVVTVHVETRCQLQASGLAGRSDGRRPIRLAKILRAKVRLAAMGRAHGEILHLARLLARLSNGLKTEDAARYLIRDVQRVIESIESLVRIHDAQKTTSMSKSNF